MNKRIVHRRSFPENEYSITFDTSIDVFKVLYVGIHDGLPTIWYETLSNPIYRKPVTLVLIRTNESIPDHSFHVGSTLYTQEMIHIYQMLQENTYEY